jgi:hypothetical protein
MARGYAHDPETKAAVIAALLAGQGVAQTAAEFKLSEATVRTWRDRDVHALRQAQNLVQEKPELGERLFHLVDAYMVAAQEMVKRVSEDAEWTKRQDASGLAVFLGVLTDKVIRILEALPEPAGGGDSVLAAGERKPEAAGR